LLVESLAGLAAIKPQIMLVDAPIANEESTDAGDQVLSDVSGFAPSKSGEQARGAIGELPLNKTDWQVPSVLGKPLPSQSGEQAPLVASKQAPNVPELFEAKSAKLPAAISETTAAQVSPIVNAGQFELTPATSDAPASTIFRLADSQNNQPPNVNQQHPVTATKVATASAVSVASNAKTATTAEQAKTSQAVSAVETANAETPVPSSESPVIGLTRLENPSPDAASESTTDSRDQTNDDSSPSENPTPSESPGDSKTSAVELTALAANALAQAPTAPEAKTDAPTPGPTASAPQAITDSQLANTTSSATAAIASLPSPRIRLPADVLTQPVAASNRRSTPAINTKSLLTRVARAFAAAQERDGEIRIRLSPPELGSLRLDVRIQDGVMVARLQTETDAARTTIIDNLPALRERLSDQGVRIERFDVDLMHRQTGGTPDQPGHQQPDAPLARLRVAAPARPRTSAVTVTRPSPAAASTGGLNVIV